MWGYPVLLFVFIGPGHFDQQAAGAKKKSSGPHDFSCVSHSRCLTFTAASRPLVTKDRFIGAQSRVPFSAEKINAAELLCLKWRPYLLVILQNVRKLALNRPVLETFNSIRRGSDRRSPIIKECLPRTNNATSLLEGPALSSARLRCGATLPSCPPTLWGVGCSGMARRREDEVSSNSSIALCVSCC